MQRKLRVAQRLQAHPAKLTETEKKQRRMLEQWARERTRKEEELDRLRRALDKKQKAVEKKVKWRMHCLAC